jgi:hypothetical protein
MREASSALSTESRKISLQRVFKGLARLHKNQILQKVSTTKDSEENKERRWGIEGFCLLRLLR